MSNRDLFDPQGDLVDQMREESTTYGTDDNEPVVCLEQTFANDAARRAHFRALLAEKLQDPAFRQIEGFPLGEDEDILNLSDPPYYTACPNPWIVDFITEWEAQKPEQLEDWHYHREPFAADVSEGKNDPIYNAHSYHTKVPHKAIMRYILHYTEPGDIVFDGFCGTGMTGVAAQMCGDRATVESLGYKVQADGTILQEEADASGKKQWVPFSKLGARRAVLNDLSPAATFIAYNYNTPVDVEAFEREAKRILAEVEAECGWMYETTHTDSRTPGKINYTVWSDVFVCPECANEVVFWESAVNTEAGKVENEFPCPHCSASLTKRNMDRAWVTKYDSAIQETIRQAKQVPVLISYTSNGVRYQKKPDYNDIALIEKTENYGSRGWFPIDELPDGSNTRQPKGSHGFSHAHHFYTRRNLLVLSFLEERLKGKLRFLLTGIAYRSTQMNRIHMKYFFFGGGGWNAGYLKGTLYIPSVPIETSIVDQIQDRLKSITRALTIINGSESSVISNSSSTAILGNSNSVDYLFLDPPFGANLNYSELNSLWESWLQVFTNNKEEAIENSTQKKGMLEYRRLMSDCFREAYRVLKPGRWMTVEFSNTKASVWNSIQLALTEAGFIIANVSALNKKQGSFKAVTTPTAVKQDLVISAYKPNGGFEERFVQEAQTEEGVWDFVRTHLKYLPVVKRQGVSVVAIPERDPRILFDQVVAYYVRKGYPVPLSSQEFQQGLATRFAERDGMFFLLDQTAEYDKARATADQMIQTSLFVSDEASAIQWLRQQLNDKPQTAQDIHPQFMRQLGGYSKNEQMLELQTLLEQSFIRYDGKGPVPEQIHRYLSSNWKDLRNLPKDAPALVTKAKDRWYVPDPNKAGDLEKLRERALLKEFETYKQVKKKLKVFRLEAVRAGFKKAWQERDYPTIIHVAELIPPKVLEEDPKLLMWYDQAQTRYSDSSLL